MKCQNIFSGKNKEIIMNLSSAELPRERYRLTLKAPITTAAEDTFKYIFYLFFLRK